MGKTFKINEETNYIEIQNGTSFDITTHEYTDIKNKVIEVQNLQKQITFATQTPTSFHIMYYLFGSASQLPQNVKDNLLKTLLKNLLEHIQLILYVLLPFVLFFLFPHHQYIKWILILVPYPLITIINMTLDSLANATQIPYAMLLPYILLFLIIIFLRRKISE